MRILHTSDWHLGKSLEGFSRLEEQEKFIDDFIDVVNDNDIDLVIIAGDIYDNGNPSAKAENLFYRAIKQISNNGRRGTIIIAGNHDNPERLSAPNPILRDQGVIFVDTPKSVVQAGKYGPMEVVKSQEGYIEVSLNGERAAIIALAYPSEKRLNELFSKESEDEERRKSYSEKIGDIFEELSKNYREDTINLAISHLFILGGEGSDSERPIELGGSLAIEVNKLPQKAQYIALGHLHKPQKVKSEKVNAYYSGSPLQYSKSEINYSKCVYIVDVKPLGKAQVKEVYLKNYKPIEVWRCKGVEAALKRCMDNIDRDLWIYLEIETDEFLTQEDIKAIKELRKDIIEIKPIVKELEKEESTFEEMEKKSMKEIFNQFYMSQRDVEPSEEIMDLFLNIVNEEEGDEVETKETEN